MGLRQISGSTQIIFTIKTFFAFIGAMLGLFYGFYQIVIVPKVNSTETHYQEMFQAQKEQNAATASELIKINTSIGTLTGTLQVIVQEKSNSQPVANTGGSFGEMLPIHSSIVIVLSTGLPKTELSLTVVASTNSSPCILTSLITSKLLSRSS